MGFRGDPTEKFWKIYIPGCEYFLRVNFDEKPEEAEMGAKPVNMRRYNFGTAEIENDEHSDMRVLRHLRSYVVIFRHGAER